MNTSSPRRDERLEPLASVLRAGRLALKCSQERLAEALRMDRPAIGSLERAQRNPTFLVLRRLVKGLGFTWREFGAALDKVDPLQ